MVHGDFTIQALDLNDPLVVARLGPEARSILKSIQTEDAKMQGSSSLARSDLHYFRARFNYYRLSLLRLLPEEKSILEPVLAQFLHRIVGFEREMGSGEPNFTPFLAPVERAAEKLPERANEKVYEKPLERSSDRVSSQTIDKALSSNPIPSQSFNSRLKTSTEDLVSQLTLIKMALSSEIDSHGRRILADGIE